MALTGNIEIFPLPEILRLLARSGKKGCLRIDTGDRDGRIYLNDGAMSLATVSSDGELLDQLAASGLIDLDRLGGRDLLDLPAATAEGKGSEDLAEAVREHTVEALHRIRRPGKGSFEFLVDAGSRFQTGQAFDIEGLVSDSERRAADWADIERTIDDMDLPVRMARELTVPDVTVNAPTWRVLSVLEGGLTVREIARHLGTTEFRAAREIASLVRSNLVEPLPTVLGTTPSPVSEEIQHTPPPPAWAAPETDTDDGATSPWSVTPEPAESPATDPWTVETDTATAADEDVASEPEDQSPAATADRSAGWWAQAMGEADQVGEVDTDEFLESVFAEEEPSDESEETGFSVGLLRRRRLGPVARDITGGN